MPKEQPTLYSVKKTMMWFAIVSLALLGSLFWIVMADHSREWKEWQKKFIELKTEKTMDELNLASKEVDQEKLKDLTRQLEETKTVFEREKAGYQAIVREIAKLDVETAKAKSQYQNLKQFEDSFKYFFEKYDGADAPKAQEYFRKLERLQPRIAESKLLLEDLERRREEKEGELKKATAGQETLEKKMQEILRKKDRAEKKLEAIKSTPAKEFLNSPMIDFAAPSLRVQQVVLEDLYDDYHFTRVNKVDRCTTCHLGIDQKGFEDSPQPFRTHPNLDLYLGEDSPHPLEKTGCTVCHGGNGHSVSFVLAAHTPGSEEQKSEWQKKHRWHSLEKWDAKMLPMNHIQASCNKCHQDVVRAPQAPKLNQGRKLAEVHGCFTCHKIQGFENRWKPGPGLEHLQSKVTKEWTAQWLRDPKVFRASTKMPKFFHLSNTSSPEDKEKNDAAIEGIATYLMAVSEPVPLTKPPVAGDVQRGEKRVKELGCLGCHSLLGTAPNDFGPELSGLGSKVKEEWLYTWLKNPLHYDPKARMPNLRLTDQEASDITSYLLSMRNADFENRPLPEVKQKVLDELVLSYLHKKLRRPEAEEELKRMSRQSKLVYLGKTIIGRQGCFACHSIKGFEEAKPIGTELTTEGSKELHQFDFGHIDIERTRHAWIYQKMKDPRIFDRGKLIKEWDDKLRMPDFGFSDEETEALTSFVLSLTKDAIPLEMQRRLNLKEQQIEKGRFLVSKFNCTGCHTMDGKIGSLWASIEDKGSAPPVLDGEGAKVQEKWLHDFLKTPRTIRPWLTYRMPTFGLTEEEITDLVQYFTHLAGLEITYKGLQIPETTPEKLAAGEVLFEKFQCVKCHQVSAETSMLGASFLAPDLGLTQERLKPEWVVEWLKDPQSLQASTMMPGFFPDGQTPIQDLLGGDAEKQIEAIRDYLYRYEPQQEQK